MQKVLYYSNLMKITIMNNENYKNKNINMYYGNNEGQIV